MKQLTISQSYCNDDNELEKIKKNVENFENYFRDNRQSYENDRRFLYKSTLTKEDETRLTQMGKPIAACNVIQPFLDRLVGEFADQTPGVSVKATTADAVSVQQEDIIEGYLRAILSDSKSKEVFVETIEESMSGGFCVIKVFTQYAEGATFDQNIVFKKAYSSNSCGFDPLARESTKCDGNYCYELFPKLKEELEKEYPDFDFSEQKYSIGSSVGSFEWSFYEPGSFDKKIINVCEYYEKRQRPRKLVLISNPANEFDPITMYKNEYKKMIDAWDLIEEPPRILKERTLQENYIVKYKIVCNKILEGPIETDYKYLPLVFFDGNSKFLDDSQMTRSYILNAKDPQRVKNYAICGLLDALENLRNSTVMIGESALPSKKEYLDAWADPQKAKSALVYKDRDAENNPVQPPQYFSPGEVQPALFQLYNNENDTIQKSLGSYDAQQGVQSGQLSGAAIMEGTTQSNSASKSYLINFLKGLNQLCKIITDLIPKYYKTATTLPIVDEKGKKDYIVINNGSEETKLDYDSSFLKVTIEPGVNFEMQKMRALKILIDLMKISETFKTMIESEGLPTLMENIDIKGKDKFILMAESFIESLKQKQAAASKNPQPDPNMVFAQAEMKKAQNQEQEMKMRYQIKDMELQQKNMQLEISRQKMMIDALKSKNELVIKQQDADTRQEKAQVESAVKQSDQIVKMAKDMVQE